MEASFGQVTRGGADVRVCLTRKADQEVCPTVQTSFRNEKQLQCQLDRWRSSHIPMAQETFSSDFRRSFLTGLGALVPTILTILILIQLYRFVDAAIGQPVNWFIKKQFRSEAGREFLVDVFKWDRKVVENKEEFEKQLDKRYPRYIGPVFGLVVVTVAMYFVGHALRSYIGRRLFWLTELLMTRFPVVKVIYPHAKQLTQFFFADKRVKFNTVVAVQYPRKGIYSIGFMTGDGLRNVTDAAGDAVVSVFIPSSPTPVTGYVIMVPARDVVELDMSVEEAFRFTITGGVIVPPNQIPPVSKAALAPPSHGGDQSDVGSPAAEAPVTD